MASHDSPHDADRLPESIGGADGNGRNGNGHGMLTTIESHLPAVPAVGWLPAPPAPAGHPLGQGQPRRVVARGAAPLDAGDWLGHGGHRACHGDRVVPGARAIRSLRAAEGRQRTAVGDRKVAGRRRRVQDLQAHAGAIDPQQFRAAACGQGVQAGEAGGAAGTLRRTGGLAEGQADDRLSRRFGGAARRDQGQEAQRRHRNRQHGRGKVP